VRRSVIGISAASWDEVRDLGELGDPCGADARGNQYSSQDGHELMAECRPVEAPEFALRSADDHAAGRVGEAVELTISPSASRNASSILSSVALAIARFFERASRAEIGRASRFGTATR
jgi:hypothetical protein